MMGNATMLLDQTYDRLREYLGLSPIDPIRRGTTANFYDERILEYFDIDFRRIFLPRHAQCAHENHSDGSFTDAWGIRYKPDGLYSNIVHSPLRHVTTVEEIDAYPWPRAEQMFCVDGLAETARRMFAETDYALVARNPVTAGFLDRASQLVETAEFLMMMLTAPHLAHRIIDHLLEVYKDVYALFLDAVGPHVQMVEVADDIGTQRGLLVSPDTYRTFIKPAEAQLYDLIHRKAPSAALFRHTDGAVFDIIPDLIEVGVDVLNPIQTSTTGMDPYLLKATYGDRIVFHGSIENLEGSAQQCIDEVKHKIDALGAGGGYVLASCNHMIDAPPENIVAMFHTAREYGRKETDTHAQQVQGPHHRCQEDV